VSSRPLAVAATAAALLAAAVPSAASAATAAPKVKLATPSQSAILSAQAAVATVTAPAKSTVALALYAGGKRVTATRALTFRKGLTVKVALGLTSSGTTRLRACSAQALELRMAVKRTGRKGTTTVRDKRTLALDAARCPAKTTTPTPTTPAPTTTTPTPVPTDANPTTPVPTVEKAPTIDLSKADRCEILVPDRCLGTWPSDYFTKKDATTPTGLRVNLKAAAMPRNAGDIAIDPTDIDQSDGFSPGQEILVHVDGMDNMAAGVATGIVPVTDLARSFDADQPVVLIDAATGERQLIWAELDANATSDAQRDLAIHPAKNLIEGHRYVVALRNMKDSDGNVIKAHDAFRIFRDNLASDQADVEARRPHFESLFKTLTTAGIKRDDLYLAWDFTVASVKNTTGRMLHIRDDAFGQLGDHDLADGDVAGTSPTFTITTITNYTSAQDARWARRIRGTVTVPCYLNGTGGDPCAPGGRFDLDGDGNPVQHGTTQAPFSCNIPRVIMDNSAVGAPKARPTMYGHGLFGSYTQTDGSKRGDLAQAGGLMMCGTDFKGMASDDQVNVATHILPDMSNFSELADRLQQGLLNFLYLGRAMVHPNGFAANAAFQADRGNGNESLIDTRRLYYTGVSEGGILGGALTAVAPDFTRSALVVPGMNYSVLLPRSTDYPNPFGMILNASYPVESDRQLILSMVQMLWDRGEPNGYANHMTTDPLPNTPKHTVVLEAGFGDHQVANVTAETEARTLGAAVRTPALDAGRSLDVTPFYGIPAITAWPYRGNALVMWDIGPLRAGGTLGTPAAPTTNTPPDAGVDPHGYAGQEAAANSQVAQFLDNGGALVDTCGATPCYAGGWTG
jgi:hypothetical protein